jgi:hypothetical protein
VSVRTFVCGAHVDGRRVCDENKLRGAGEFKPLPTQSFRSANNPSLLLPEYSRSPSLAAPKKKSL